MYSVEEIKDNYKSFSDSKIENIARNESKGLRKEILGILKSEIERRNLDKRLITWVEAETNTLTNFEKKKLSEKIQHLNCPDCGSKHSNLSGHKFTTIFSVIIYSNQIEKNRIFCNSCAKNERIQSFLTTGLFGWWSIKGLFLTPYTMITEIINISMNKKKISDRIINEFIETNNGLFRLHGTEDDSLRDIILYHNNDYQFIEEVEIDNEIE